MEAAKVFCWLPPCGSHFIYVGRRWSLLQQCKQAFEGGARSLGHDFYAAISCIAYVAAQVKAEGSADDKVTEADSLYLSMHRCMKFLHFVRAVLAHAHYDSILLPTALVSEQISLLRSWTTFCSIFSEIKPAFSPVSVKAAKL